ncbi:MAG: 50S ribosomal protein L11 methyltransferase [Tenuifilaceae bacterium]|jgi:ribosomal protein L11 methyltransferase|nr:50S ribosomal protein L11 methyltransferase [Tenuifilaceae bacterium]
MNYTEVNIEIKPYSQQNTEILTALLAELGFDSFTDSDSGLIAYIPTSQFNENELTLLLNNLPFDVEVNYVVAHIADQNWNTKWESNFDPITVENFCRVRAPFHKPEPGYSLEIVIEPKMAFGTGHHQTTWLMIREMFSIDLMGKTILDMGCGTGILAIVAEKLGASRVTAIDNDSWAYENSMENVSANRCSRINVVLGDASSLKDENYDVILANINLNILLNDLPTYRKHMNTKGYLLMSGILTSDIQTISEAAKENGLSVLATKSKNDWAFVLTQSD